MTPNEKRYLSEAVLNHVADLFDNWDERVVTGQLAGAVDIDPEEAKLQISKWMNRLPGDAWDSRLTPVEDL